MRALYREYTPLGDRHRAYPNGNLVRKLEWCECQQGLRGT
ncbi:Uncharacterised protein [Vibrio cholerae]|nr:Uncharacterised protein [Vibrio cholerae]